METRRGREYRKLFLKRMRWLPLPRIRSHCSIFKRGESVLDNCQILQQRANRFKGNEDDDKERIKSYSCKKEIQQERIGCYRNGNLWGRS